MERRHSWTSTIDGVDHRIEVIYHALTGWMEIEVDGVRQARGWREWQTVVGGANLSCTIGSHRVDARVTQPFGAQDYSFALQDRRRAAAGQRSTAGAIGAEAADASRGRSVVLHDLRGHGRAVDLPGPQLAASRLA